MMFKAVRELENMDKDDLLIFEPDSEFFRYFNDAKPARQ